MSGQINRREFLELTAGGALCFAGAGLFAGGVRAAGTKLISPGCRRSKVKVARIYMGPKRALWPKPSMNIQEEIAFYGKQFDKLGAELADVEFPVNSLVSSAAEVGQIAGKLKDVRRDSGHSPDHGDRGHSAGAGRVRQAGGGLRGAVFGP